MVFFSHPGTSLAAKNPEDLAESLSCWWTGCVCLPQKELAAKALFGVGCRVINRFTASSSVKAKAG
jgi:hypothetical protein